MYIQRVSFSLLILFITLFAQLDSVTIQLKWFHQFQFAGYYAAIEKGYYEEEGIHVTLRERVIKEDFVDVVLNGKAQYGISDVSLVAYHLQDKPVVLLKQIYQHSPYALITLEKSGYISPIELSGKRIAIDTRNISDAPIAHMLSTHTLHGFDSLNIVQSVPTQNMRHLIDGKIDAFTCYLSNEPYDFKKQNIPISIINPQSYGIDLYGDNFFTSEKEFDENPERVEKVIRATLKGWSYALNNSEEICSLIQKKYAPSKSVEKLKYEAEVIRTMIVPDLIPIGTTIPQRYRVSTSLYKKMGFVQKDSVRDDFFYDHRIKAKLSRDEKLWLRKHAPITFALDSHWTPLVLRDSQGEWEGMYVDLLAIINKKLGSDFVIKPGSWGKIINSVNQRKTEYDVLMATAVMGKDERYLNYTKSYSAAQKYIIMRNSDKRQISSLKDLNGMKVAIGKGWNWERKMLSHDSLNITVVEVDPQKRFEKLVGGELDAFVANVTLFYTLNDLELNMIRVAHMPSEGAFSLHLGVRRDLGDTLVNILNRAIKSISQEEMNTLRKKWQPSKLKEKQPLLSLTEEERAYLSQKPEITIGFDPMWPPLEFLDSKGNLQGISNEIINEVEEMLGITFTRKTDLSWDSLMTLSKEGKLDGFACISKTAQRSKFLLFSDPYIQLPIVVFTRNDINYINSLKELKGRKLAIIKGYAIEEWIRHDYPEIDVVLYANIDEALKGVARKEVDAYVENILSGSYAIQKLGLTNIKVSGETEYKNDLSIGISRDNPLLVNIINKAVNTISEEKKYELTSKWQKVEYTTKVDYKRVLQIMIPLILILLVIIIWNRMLKSEVQKRKEAELVAEKANSAKSIFLANMSHEIRTPLNAIIGFSHIIKESTTDNKSRYYGELIVSSGNTLLTIINDILDLSKIEAGKFELKPAPLNMVNLAKEIDLLFESSARGKGIDFEVINSDIQKKSLIIDEVRLRQIIINLCGNALKFTDKGAITVVFQTLHTTTNITHLKISVKDTGCGIAPEQLQRIFEAFAQSEGQSIAKYGGTGLGLSISRKLTSLMGGEILVESELGKGSIFTVSIPNVKTSNKKVAANSHDDVTYSFAPATILIADDIKINREVLRGLLRNFNFTFYEAEDGDEAYNLTKEKYPDCLLIDIKMPNRNGDDVAEQLRKEGFTKPIIAVSASVMKNEEERVERVCNALIHKPVVPHELIEKLASVLPNEVALKQEDNSNEIDTKIIGNNLTILDKLSPFVPEVKRLLDNMAIDEISAFASKVTKMAIDAKCQTLEEWTEALCNAINLFDIEKMTDLLHNFLKEVEDE